jgi:hypothetical protein
VCASLLLQAWRQAIRVVFKDVPYMIQDRADPDWQRPWESPFIGRLLAEMSIKADAKSAKLIRKLLPLVSRPVCSPFFSVSSTRRFRSLSSMCL